MQSDARLETIKCPFLDLVVGVMNNLSLIPEGGVGKPPLATGL